MKSIISFLLKGRNIIYLRGEIGKYVFNTCFDLRTAMECHRTETLIQLFFLEYQLDNEEAYVYVTQPNKYTLAIRSSPPCKYSIVKYLTSCTGICSKCTSMIVFFLAFHPSSVLWTALASTFCKCSKHTFYPWSSAPNLFCTYNKFRYPARTCTQL